MPLRSGAVRGLGQFGVEGFHRLEGGWGAVGVGHAPGLGLTVANACAAVLEAADWTSPSGGGDGAVREACEFILAARGDWQSTESGFA